MARLTKAAVTQLATQRDALAAQIKTLMAQKAGIDAKLNTYAEAHGNKVDLGTYTIARVGRLTFSPALIEAAFPVADNPNLYKLALDTKALHDALSKNDARQYQFESFSLAVTRNA